MTNEPASTDEILTDELLALDEALASGFSVASAEEPPTANGDYRPRRGLKALHALQHLRRRPADPYPTIPRHDSLTPGGGVAGAIPLRLGRFTIREELGRGGFGVVFRAHDPKLHRDVALKVPHAQALADPALRERFRREAQAAGSLDHPNIVPVFEVDEQGPIIAIAYAYCPGISLGTWLAERTAPVPPNDAACLIADLADAVQHAHDRGVVHRDLKPANVLLLFADCGLQIEEHSRSSDRQSAIHNLPSAIPKITDFGLAKLADDDQSITRAGAVVGTPEYMAPEQARAKAIGPSVDVYALGSMLYELLVGRTPFRGESGLDTLQLVLHQDPVAPRQLRPKLPRDLETVCLKCLEKDVGRRYTSAAALRDDLRRFLAGEPVVARPVSALARAARWCKRKPVIAGLAAALVAAIALGITGVVREYRRANFARDMAVAQRDRATRLLGHAHVMLERVQDIGETLRGEGQTLAAGRRVLQESVKYFDALMAEAGDDPELRRAVAKAAVSAGIAQKDLAQLDEAAATLRHAINSLGQIRDGAATPDDHYQYARAHLLLGHVYLDQRKLEPAEEMYRGTVALCQSLIEPPNPDRRALRDVALATMHIGLVERLNKSWQVALPTLQRSADMCRSNLAAFPDDVNVRLDLTAALDFVSATHLYLGQLAEAEATCREALVQRRDIAEERKRSTAAKLALAQSHARLGDIAKRGGRHAAAQQAFTEGAVVYEKLTLTSPSNHMVFRDYAQMMTAHANLMEAEKRWAEAGEKYRRAVQLRSRVVELQPTSPRRQIELMDAASQAGKVFHYAKDHQTARTFLATAKAVQARLTTPPEELSKMHKSVSDNIAALERALAAKGL